MFKNRLSDRLRHLYRDQRGQTPTEYLMIVGLMAAVIVAVFTVAFWPMIKTVSTQWIQKVSDTVLGTNIK